MTRAKNYKTCEDCTTLVKRIKEFEAFAVWVKNLDPTRYDEILCRVDEVLENKGDYYAG
jgi:hypothetical protein